MFFTVIGGFSLLCSFGFLIIGEFLNALYLFLAGALFLFIGYKINENQERQRRAYSIEYNNNISIENERVKEEYDRFAYDTSIRNGMTIEEVKSICPYRLVSEVQKTSAQLKGICPTCGGKIVDGTCQYCGNSYNDHSNITVLTYLCKYGKRAYTFNHGKLESIYTESQPLNNFLR